MLTRLKNMQEEGQLGKGMGYALPVSGHALMLHA